MQGNEEEQHFLGAKVPCCSFPRASPYCEVSSVCALALCMPWPSRHNYSVHDSAPPTNQDFGVFILLMNTVASFVSGFVLVQVPAQASVIGFMVSPWLQSCRAMSKYCMAPTAVGSWHTAVFNVLTACADARRRRSCIWADATTAAGS